ncbi:MULTISPECIES: hypothetical protein [Roseomonadaceae]|uniref:Uncharacterized protein n=1 Tax=Falsiroseomonas oleicola TaxID=2801474 RepID=A0ABS6H0P2_9PROT|nr:hypothetical protein [Roseomonas oleicola]MBU8542236.1 hypothetical protein [Roseomonas oleicola]
MDVKEGHPGAIFHWFFDTDQGAANPANILIMLHGSSSAMEMLIQSCLENKNQFDDALGPEIMLLFFDPDLSARAMSEGGVEMRESFERGQSANFLFAGMGAAYPVPSALFEIGRDRFRSERPGGSIFQKVAREVAASNGRAIPFFQQVFSLKPQQDYFLIAHRINKSVQLYGLGESASISLEDMLAIIRNLRPIARHYRGESDLDAIGTVVYARMKQGAIRHVARSVWQALNSVIRAAPRRGLH